MPDKDSYDDRYSRLIEGIGREASVKDLKSLHDNCNLVVNDVTFSVMRVNFVHVDRVMLFVEFGRPPYERRDLVLQRLLETNLYMCCDEDTPTFSFNAETGSVVMTSRLSLSTLTPTSLLALMRHLSDYVKSWRASHFLNASDRGQRGAVGNQTRSNSLARTLQKPFDGPSNRAAGGGQ